MKPTGTRILIETTLKTESEGGLALLKPEITNIAIVKDAGKSKELRVGMKVVYSIHSGYKLEQKEDKLEILIEENDIWGYESILRI